MRRDDEGLDRELADLLKHLDHPLPRVTAREVIARAERGGARWVRWAAGVLLTLTTGGVAYAMPGSPLPAWVATILPGDEAVAVAGQRGDAATPDTGGGLAVDPGGGLVVEVAEPTVGGALRITVADGREVAVQGPVGAARFTSEPGRLIIDPLRADTVEIVVPRTAARVEITVAGRSVFLLSRAGVTADVAPDLRGTYLVPLPPEG